MDGGDIDKTKLAFLSAIDLTTAMGALKEHSSCFVFLPHRNILFAACIDELVYTLFATELTTDVVFFFCTAFKEGLHLQQK